MTICRKYNLMYSDFVTYIPNLHQQIQYEKTAVDIINNNEIVSRQKPKTLVQSVTRLNRMNMYPSIHTSAASLRVINKHLKESSIARSLQPAQTQTIDTEKSQTLKIELQRNRSMLTLPTARRNVRTARGLVPKTQT